MNFTFASSQRFKILSPLVLEQAKTSIFMLGFSLKSLFSYVINRCNVSVGSSKSTNTNLYAESSPFTAFWIDFWTQETADSSKNDSSQLNFKLFLNIEVSSEQLTSKQSGLFWSGTTCYLIAGNKSGFFTTTTGAGYSIFTSSFYGKGCSNLMVIGYSSFFFSSLGFGTSTCYGLAGIGIFGFISSRYREESAISCFGCGTFLGDS